MTTGYVPWSLFNAHDWSKFNAPRQRKSSRPEAAALREVLRVLRVLADRKTTMIIVTHEMHFARDVADRILFMDGGVVVEEGPAKQLIDHPREQRTKQFLAHYAE